MILQIGAVYSTTTINKHTGFQPQDKALREGERE
jgi:hypothetical protein